MKQVQPSDGHWGWALAIAVGIAWLLTFFLAMSDCTVQAIVRFECTDWKWGRGAAAITDVKEAAALKGQFGDLFGILNGAFGALTLLFVYRAFRLESKSSHAQIELVRLERYYTEVDAATQSYNRLLRDVLVPDKDQNGNLRGTWPGAHGLFHLWKAVVAEPQSKRAIRPGRGGYDDYPDYWKPAVELYALGNTTVQEAWRQQAWVDQQFTAVDDTEKGQIAIHLRHRWQVLYTGNRYQLDALFRAWYHVCKTIKNANEYRVDGATEWRIASRFRAQLSWVELLFLLANQVLSEGDEGNGFPEAVKYSERYAMFDNFVPGLDPAAHALVRIADASNQWADGRSLKKECFSSNLARKAAFPAIAPRG